MWGGAHFNHFTCAFRSSGWPRVVKSPACSSTSPSGMGVVWECVSEIRTKRTHSGPGTGGGDDTSYWVYTLVPRLELTTDIGGAFSAIVTVLDRLVCSGVVKRRGGLGERRRAGGLCFPHTLCQEGLLLARAFRLSAAPFPPETPAMRST